MDNLNFLKANQLTELIFQFIPDLQKYVENKFVFYDVGAAGDIHPLTYPLKNLIKGVLFEPDGPSFEKLMVIHEGSDYEIYKYALGKASELSAFYQCLASTNNSNLKPNQRFIDRYQATNFSVTAQQSIQLESIDSLLSRGLIRSMPDFLKIDTQGTELNILQGALKPLNESVTCLLIEAEFFEVYEGQPLLDDICTFLRPLGFSLYGLYPRYRSTKRFKHLAPVSEERVMWADCVFFKDPLLSDKVYNNINQRQSMALILGSLLLGFYDYALELVEAFDKVNFDNWAMIVQSLSDSRVAHIDSVLAKWGVDAAIDRNQIMAIATQINSSTDFYYELFRNSDSRG